MSKIKIQTLISGDLESIWDYYLKPEHIIHWNFASDDWQCPKAEVDLKIGGIHSSRMESKDGSMGFDFNLTFTDLVMYRSFSYVMEDGREATTTFNASGDQIEVSIIFDPESENSEELQKKGWQAILENFKKYVEEI